MSKIFSFKIADSILDDFFSPIRKKEDYLNLIFKAMRFMYVVDPVKNPEGAEMYLVVNKCSRLIFSKKDKIFSVSFPFHVNSPENKIATFYSACYGEISIVTISDTLSLLNSEEFKTSPDIEDFDSLLCELSSYSKPGYWLFLKELFFLESGYIRYDYDPVRERGLKHPLSHLDVFYSTKASFKLGLAASIERNDFLDILNPATNCYFLEKKD